MIDVGDLIGQIGHLSLEAALGVELRKRDRMFPVATVLQNPLAGFGRQIQAYEIRVTLFEQVNDPQAMVSSFAQSVAHALAQQAETAPQIDAEQWPLLVELVAIYLGFGVPMTNTAFAFAGGCGGCGKKAAQRQAVLSQDEALFGLALFCKLKQIESKEVLAQLKPHLKKLYKRACHQLEDSPGSGIPAER